MEKLQTFDQNNSAKYLLQLLPEKYSIVAALEQKQRYIKDNSRNNNIEATKNTNNSTEYILDTADEKKQPKK